MDKFNECYERIDTKLRAIIDAISEGSTSTPTKIEHDDFSTGYVVNLGHGSQSDLYIEVLMTDAGATDGELGTNKAGNVIIRAETDTDFLFSVAPDNYTNKVWADFDDIIAWEHKLSHLESQIPAVKKQIADHLESTLQAIQMVSR